MPSEGLFDGLFARGGAAEQVDDRAWLRAMLDVETALARACARHDLCPPAAAAAITEAAARTERFDIAAIGHEAARSGTPVMALVAALRAAAGAEAAPFVHRGATSQDIIDSAASLVARRALEPILADAAGAAAACATLADEHRRTVMAGRTLLQHALPTTFGLRSAGWLVGLDEARVALRAICTADLAVQLGGAAGTLAAYGDRGPAIAAALAAELGLAEPTVPWHAIRRRPAALAGALGTLSGVAAKIGRDVTLLAQSEVGELREGGSGRGGSSSMPQKRNPVGSVMVTACGARVPGLVATMLGVMAQEHERGAGGWPAEWETQTQLLRVSGAQLAWLRELLENLEVDGERMRVNVEAAGELLMAESVVTVLAGHLGVVAARKLTDDAVARAQERDIALGDALREQPEVMQALGADGIAAALSPDGYLGASGALIDRALAAHQTAVAG